MKRYLINLILFFVIQVSFAQIDFVQEHQPSDLANNDLFGISLATNGEFLFVGASFSDDAYHGEDCGAVYVYENSKGWGQTQKLQPLYTDDDVSFGNTISMNENYAIVGAYYDSYNDYHEGSAYIYYLNYLSDGLPGKYLLPDVNSPAGLFGYAVDVSENYAVVTAILDNTSGENSGTVYLFGKDVGGGDHWGLVKKIVPENPFNNMNFGYSIKIGGDTLYVGVLGDNINGDYSGACNIYVKDEGGTDNWGKLTTLYPSDGSEYDNFGSYIYLKDNYLFISAENAGNTSQGEGAVYVFERNGSGNWIQQTKITADVPEASSKFGSSITYDMDLLFIGASRKTITNENEGQVYVFLNNEGVWSQVQELNSNTSGDDYFGKAIASFGESVFVGIPKNTETSGNDKKGIVYEYFINPISVKNIDNHNVLIYPNPAKDYINISLKSEIGLLKILDISGKLIIKKQINSSETSINISNLKSGIYFIEMSSGKNDLIIKLIVQ